MVEAIDIFKCVHSFSTGLMVSMLLGLAIQANIAFSSSTCNEKGLVLESGSTKCEYTDDRIWTLVIFYSGAVVFFIGAFVTCSGKASGFVLIVFVLALITWLGVIAGLTIQRMNSDSISVNEAIEVYTGEVIRDNWDVWSTISKWMLGISFAANVISTVILTVYFILYKEAIVLVLLTHVGWYDPKHLLWQCSRDKSRIVRNIIQKKFIPILERYRVSMPIDCPFHPNRDSLWWPESEDEEDDDELSFQWTCPFCGSTFLCAERLAIHWDETHKHYFSQRDDSICLADFCDIMRCDVIISNKRNRRNRLRSLALSKHKKQLITKKECNSDVMKKLEKRCEYVIRLCTQGLLSNISVKDYRDIEYDLISSVCSYLNCDRYLDDYSNERRNVPLTLCMAIGVIMIGGFCLCYYIVWMLFDSGYKSRNALITRESMGKDINSAYIRGEEIKFKRIYSESKNLMSVEDRIPVSERPKILVTSPSTQRFIRSQQHIHYYHPNQPNHPNQYSSIEEDSWESCVDVPTRSTAYSSNTSATTAAIHSRPESASRASSHTTSHSIQSNPYNR